MRAAIPDRLSRGALLAAGLLIIADLLVVNPWLGALAGVVQQLLVLLLAGVAVMGGVALAWRHATDLLARRGDRVGSIVVLAGIGAVLLAGFRPGSTGVTDVSVRWLVAALLVPLAAAMLALVFVFLLGALRRSRSARPAETGLLLLGAIAATALLLPIGGTAGTWLAGAEGWLQSVLVGGVFRGILLGVAVIGSVTALRILIGMGADD